MRSCPRYGGLAEIWRLLTTSPVSFRGGGIWSVITDINGALKAIGFALLVLFFIMGVVKTCGSFTELKKPEMAVKCFIRFILAKAAVSYGLDIMIAIFRIAQGGIGAVKAASGLTMTSAVTLPADIVTKIEGLGFLDSIPLWLVSLLGSLFIWVLSIIMILSVYGRFFKLYLGTAIAPIPLAAFAGEPSSNMGKAFLKSYAAICLEGLIIVLACIIFSVFAASPPALGDPSLSAVTIVWNYIAEFAFNALVLVGTIKMADRLIREFLGLN